MGDHWTLVRWATPPTSGFKRALAGLAACVCLNFVGICVAEDFEMDEILVTGSRQDPVFAQARSVTVIGRDELNQSPSANVAEILAREANINLRSLFGNDKFAGVDIRGMGDTFGSNVLVLVDGVRQNSADLSGADYASVDVSQIERIEVIRGGGGVRYGNGAVGGVINIITRESEGTLHGRAGVGFGSFDAWHVYAGGSGGYGPISAKLRVAAKDTHGFRDNGEFVSRDGDVALRFTPLEWFKLGLSAEIHDDRFGLPGPVSLSDFRRSHQARVGSSNPMDGGDTLDRRYRSEFELDLKSYGELKTFSRFRRRNNESVIGFTPGLSVAEQRDEIIEHSHALEIDYSVVFDWFGEHEFGAGYSAYDADYERRENGRQRIGSSRRFGRIDNNGTYAHLKLSLPYRLNLNLGYRRDRFRQAAHAHRQSEDCVIVLANQGTSPGGGAASSSVSAASTGGSNNPAAADPIFVEVPVEVPILVEVPAGSGNFIEVGTQTIILVQEITTASQGFNFDPSQFKLAPDPVASSPPVTTPAPTAREVCTQTTRYTPVSGDTWYNSAWEMGVLFSPLPQLNVYFNYSRSFRNPNVDELILASSDIGPQQGNHFDLGLRYRRDWLELALGVFRIDIENEIFFGFDIQTNQNLNLNLDEPTRRDGVELELKLKPPGDWFVWSNVGYVDARQRETNRLIPLVPKWTVTVGARYQPRAWLDVSLIGRHVSGRVDGNDFSNTQFERLNSYRTVDARMNLKHGPAELSLGINNLLDAVYSTAGYSNTRYPMPGRHAFINLKMTL